MFNLFPLNLSTKTKASSNLEINIFSPESLTNASILTSFGNSLGIKFSSAKWFSDWSYGFESDMARNFHNQGVIPDLSWEPINGPGGFSYNNVLAGQYDNYLNNYATSVRNLGFPVRITLAPEMNGDWEQYYIDANGNTAENFKSFWRYTVDKFRAQGVNNVSWIWSPNVHFSGEPYSYANFYPGDNYVDYVGLQGYNWGTTQDWSAWQSFSDIFRASYNDIIRVSNRDVIITEFASTEQGGDKAQWILDMFRDARNNFSRLKGVTWFNEDKETDWRIESSSTSLAAFKQGVHADYTPVGNSGSQNQSQNNTQSVLPKKSQNTPDKSNSAVSVAQTNDAVKVDTQKSNQYTLLLTKKAFPNDKPLKAVLAAKTVKSNLKPYFAKENILLLKIIIEFILFSFFLIVAWLFDRFKRTQINQNQ